jgi:putative ABC transport system permease protein
MTRSSLGALARLARRDIGRHRLRSLLVVALVALPVAAMVGGIAIYRTIQPTQEREIVATMGQADLISYGATREQLLAALPAGSTLEPATTTDDRLIVPGARPGVALRGLDLGGLAAGMVTLVGGAAPTGAGQVAISASVAKLASVGIGGRIQLEGLGAQTVVGIVENPLFLPDRIVLVDPQAVALGDPASATWLVRLPPGVDPDAVVEAVTDPQSGAQSVPIQSATSNGLRGVDQDAASPAILVLGSLALVESALIASAAFAVSIRRRQRELGLLAATGASPRQLAGTVVVEAGILGLLGCLVGVAAGFAAAEALTPWLDQLTQHRNPPLVVDLTTLFGPVLVGLAAAMLAAIVPARTVARMPVLLALSGRRPAGTSARRTLVLGVAAVVVAATMTVMGATMRGAGDETLSVVLLIGGAVLSTLGFGACGPWLLEKLERIGARLPLAGRIAFRDTARGRSRTSPIVTAILASLAGAIALGAWQASRDVENLATWRPELFSDELLLQGSGATSAVATLRQEDAIVRGQAVPSLVFSDPSLSASYQLPDAEDSSGRRVNTLDRCGNCNPGAFAAYQLTKVSPATPEILALAHAQGAAAILQAGTAVVLANGIARAPTLEIAIYAQATSSDPIRRVTVPAQVISVPVVGDMLPQLFLPQATIRDLGLVEATPEQAAGEHGVDTLVLQYDHPVTDADVAHAQQVASAYPDTFASVDTPPGRQGELFRLVITALVLLFALSVTGMAIALGEAESRPEQRTLLAIGADPRLRRRIAAARAAVLALLAGILAVPAGLLPIWGIFTSRGSAIAVPTIEIAGAVLALPLLAIASSWLLSRPIPDWSAFRDVGAS